MMNDVKKPSLDIKDFWISFLLFVLATGGCAALYNRMYVWDIPFSGLAAIGVIFLVTWAVLPLGFRTIRDLRRAFCPKCGSYRTITVGSGTRQNEYMDYGTREIRHYDRDGELAGHSEVDYHEPAVRTTTVRRRRCLECDHGWVTDCD